MATGNDEEGMPVQIVSVNEDHTFTLNEEALENILKDVKDLPVVVISIAGAMRQGKSFLLSFFIRYLRAKGASDWLGDKNLPLNGFSWRGGCEADTSGILMWSQPFQVQIPSGKTVAVLLMDTQGAFDNKSTVNDCATIFALSTLISSVQIFNIKDLIKENDLQNLQIFTEYGKLALENSDQKPFQKLLFLVRDWASEINYTHGSEGGMNYIDKTLEVNKEQHVELSDVRRSIRACFEEISCFLMPHPGLVVARANFEGRIVDLRDEFVEKMSELVQDVFAPENLRVKNFFGQQINAEQLLTFFKEYMEVFQDGQIPEIQSMFKATADAINMTAVTKAKELYQSRMESAFELSRFCIAENALRDFHLNSQNAALECFQQERKFCGQELTENWLNTLGKILEALYIEFLERNKEIGANEEAASKDTFSESLQAYKGLVEEKLKEKIRFSTEDLLNVHQNLKAAAILKLENAISLSVGEPTKIKLTTNLSKEIEKRYLDVQEQIKLDRELKSHSIEGEYNYELKKLKDEDQERWRVAKYQLSLENRTKPLTSLEFKESSLCRAESASARFGRGFTGGATIGVALGSLAGRIPGAAIGALVGGFVGGGSGIIAGLIEDNRELHGQLQLHKCGMLELKPSFPPENSKHLDQWFKIVLDFTRMVLANREMFVLTWHDAEDIFILEPLDYTIEKIGEMSYLRARLTKKFLTDACTSPQFAYSEMAFTSPTPSIVDARKLRGCTKENISQGYLNIVNEYVCMNKTGSSLFWLNPAMTLQVVKSILKKNDSGISVTD